MSNICTINIQNIHTINIHTKPKFLFIMVHVCAEYVVVRKKNENYDSTAVPAAMGSILLNQLKLGKRVDAFDLAGHIHC